MSKYHFLKNKIPKKQFLFTAFLLSGLTLLFPQAVFAEGYIQGFLYTFVVNVFGTFAGWAGTILDFTINYMVIGFGQLYIDKGLGFTVDALWVVVRDIFNLTFIFGLVFIGLRMIFDSSNSNTRKMLISLMLAALFVNFSLFITKVVVDFSNIATVQLVNSFPPDNTGKPSISASFSQIAGTPTFFDPKPSADTFKQFKEGSGYGFIIGMMVLLVLQTFVFFAGAILLMIRFAVLTMYMILSPLMFLGFVFPSAMGISKEYWSGFISRAFFAPAYILMLYLSQKVLSGFQVVGPGGKTIAESLGSPTKDSIMAVLPPFILSAIFLIASIVIAQKMGANGASGVISVGKMMTGKVKGYAKNTGVGAFNAATYVPRAVTRAGVNAGGKAVLKSFEKAQSTAQANATAPGAGWGAKAVGWVATRNATDRAARKVGEGMKKAEFGTGTTNEKEDEYARKVQSGINQTQANAQREADRKSAQAILNDTTIPHLEVTLTNALDSLAKTIRDMTKEEKENLTLAELTDKNIAVNLSDSDIDNLEKSGKFSTQDIKNIKDARKLAYKSVASHGSTLTTVDPVTGNITGYSHANAGTMLPSLVPGGAPVPTTTATMDRRSKLAGMGVREVGKLPIEVFKEQDVYAHITPSMLEERMRNGIDPADIPKVREALEHHLGLLPGITPLAAGLTGPWAKWEGGNSIYAAQFFV